MSSNLPIPDSFPPPFFVVVSGFDGEKEGRSAAPQPVPGMVFFPFVCYNSIVSGSASADIPCRKEDFA